jgi:hypothetical protein
MQEAVFDISDGNAPDPELQTIALGGHEARVTGVWSVQGRRR